MNSKVQQLMQELEALIGSDYFEVDAEEIMSRLEEEGASCEIIPELLAIMERHPLDDFGCPGIIVQFIEQFYPEYLHALIDSLRSAPALQTVFMLNRCINAGDKNGELLSVLKEVAGNKNTLAEVRKFAEDFIEYQTKK